MNGPRRWGSGTWRDYVIGIEAVDGLGRIYHAGGRVVKNVAGYDFCRLLVGSCGMLGIVTQVTLKVKPKSEMSFAFLIGGVKSSLELSALLETLSKTKTSLSAVEVRSNPIDEDSLLAEMQASAGFHIAIFFEGSESEVAWMKSTLLSELLQLPPRVLDYNNPQSLLKTFTNSIASRAHNTIHTSPTENLFSLKTNIPSSKTVEWIDFLLAIDSNCSIHAHALSGIVHPRARELGGFAQVWNFPSQIELTGPTAWGSMGDTGRMLTEIRKQFDPQSVLNPGRFW
jgi:glycolate oxidase FAD binding subunit